MMKVTCPVDGEFTAKKPERSVQKLRFTGDLDTLPDELRPDKNARFLTEDAAQEYMDKGWAEYDFEEVTVDVYPCPDCGTPVAVEQ